MLGEKDPTARSSGYTKSTLEEIEEPISSGEENNRRRGAPGGRGAGPPTIRAEIKCICSPKLD